MGDVKAKVLVKRISTVGQLVKALSQLPNDTLISPFGSETAKLVYKESENRVYIDEDFSDFDEDDLEAIYGED